jgi:transposase InsO family protein
MTAGKEILTLTERASTKIQIVGQNDKLEEVLITDALINPALNINLISVSKLDKAGYTVVFTAGTCKIINGAFKSDQPLAALGTLSPSSNVYVLSQRDHDKVSTDKLESDTLLFATPKNGQLHRATGNIADLHKRFGHVSLDHLLQLARHGEAAKIICEPCSVGKVRRSPFRGNAHILRASKPGEGVHADAVGPLRTATLGGHKYILFLTDCYSGYVSTYLLARKDQQVEKLSIWIKWARAQTSNTLKWLRADGEWQSGEISTLRSEHGFEIRMTNRQTPQMNGVAERVGGHLVEKARVILIASGLPAAFFGEAIHFITHVRNRTPRSNFNEKIMASPMELFYGTPAPIHHFKTFGSKAYVRIA